MIKVTKRNGTKEALDLDKIHRVVEAAALGLSKVSVSEIELKAELQFFEGITTEGIQETLIKSAVDLITEEAPDYQYVASRLINFDLRKRVYGQYEPIPLIDIVRKNVALGLYEPKLLEWYSEEDWRRMDTYIKHDRDYTIVYAGMEQFRQKYLTKKKTTNQYFETPQVAYMLIAAIGHANEDASKRLRFVRDFYNAISQFDLSLPTPIMAKLRSTKKQFSSCTLIDVGDSLDSIIAGGGAIVKYAAMHAGIGVNVGRIRAVGSNVREGDTVSTGMIPFIKKLTADLKSCNQGGIRSASGNFCFPMWHYEYQDLIVLKNNKGTEDNRNRAVDYTVQINKTLLNRLLDGKDITLFSPNDVPGLYEAFFRSNDEFEHLYVQYENTPGLRKKTIPAMDAFSDLILQRKETGRIYIQFVDNTNELGTFDPKTAPVVMTNLCVEITEPTKPLNDLNDVEGEIALCTLAAYNLGNMKTPQDFEKIAPIVVRFLDNLLTYQGYPVKAAETSNDKYRNLGIGIVNLAYFLAKHNQHYDQAGAEFVHPFAEAMSYYTIKASVDLAKERGKIPGFDTTKWSQGLMPIDRYRPFMDTIVKNDLLLDWGKLREEVLEHGIRNATLLAGMPAETSAQIANATNGFEQPRAFVSIKNSKDGSLKQVVPELLRLKKKYDLLWDSKSPRGYLEVVATFNKFFCQSISTNTSYNPEFFEDHQIPMSILLGDIIYSYQLGLKTLYYNNEHDSQGEINISESDNSKVDNSAGMVYDEYLDENCEACVI